MGVDVWIPGRSAYLKNDASELPLYCDVDSCSLAMEVTVVGGTVSMFSWGETGEHKD